MFVLVSLNENGKDSAKVLAPHIPP